MHNMCLVTRPFQYLDHAYVFGRSSYSSPSSLNVNNVSFVPLGQLFFHFFFLLPESATGGRTVVFRLFF